MACYNCIVKLSDETDNAADLYIIYKKKLDDKTKSYLSNLRAVIGDSKLFLRKFSEQWKNFTTFLVCLQKMFHYLDRYYLKNGAEKSMTLTETALSIWKSTKPFYPLFLVSRWQLKKPYVWCLAL